MQDCNSYDDHFGCSYDRHIATVIDELLKMPDHDINLVRLSTTGIIDVAQDGNDTDNQSNVPPNIEAIFGPYCSKDFAVTQDISGTAD